MFTQVRKAIQPKLAFKDSFSKSSLPKEYGKTLLAATPMSSVPIGPLSAGMAKLLQVLPPVAAQVVFLAPMQTMREFKRNGTTGGVSPLPYTAMALNGYLWTIYGGLNNDPTIMLANVSGFILGTYYMSTYATYRPKDVSMTPHYAVGATVMSAAALAAVALPVETAIPLIGFTACAVVVVMFSGPLASIQTVLKEKSTASIPFSFTLATVVNCVSWAAYGYLVINDPFVWGPNTVGLAAGLVQLGLFAKFGFKK